MTDGSGPDAAWRSPLLGQPRTVSVDGGSLEYFERGDGPAVVFAHGWLANANLWRNVVDRLHERFRCLTVDLPLGSHLRSMDADADLGPDGIAALIASVLDDLDLAEVILVGNDSGGAYSQIAVARHTHRVAQLVLVSCETPFDHWPPAPFENLPTAALDQRVLQQLFEALGRPDVIRSELAYGGLIKHQPDDQVLQSYARPAVEDKEVLRATAKAISSASTAAIQSAGRQLINDGEPPVLLAWSAEDRMFPLAHAEQYAGELSHAQLTVIDDSYSFVPEDQPGALADAIATFAELGRERSE